MYLNVLNILLIDVLAKFSFENICRTKCKYLYSANTD